MRGPAFEAPGVRRQRETFAQLVRQRSGLGGHAFEESDIDRFVQTMARLPDPPASVVDIGCGTGVLVDVLGGLGYETLGVDTDERAMAAMSQPHMLGSASDLPLDTDGYDVAVLNEILEHLPVGAYERSLEETARVAKSRIIVTVPNAESLESASTRCRRCGCVFSIHGHVRRFQPEDLADLFPGFLLSSIDTVGPYKLRHRSVEWLFLRRLLGRWPSQVGALCPQCGFREPGTTFRRRRDANRLKQALRWAYAVPWQRWWLIARYDRNASSVSASTPRGDRQAPA